MKTFSLSGCILAAILLVSIASCKKDEIEDPIVPNEEEIITTLIYTLTPTIGNEVVTYTFLDMDGDGPMDPEVTESGSLAANSQYLGSILLLNETESPVDTVNAEINTEAEEHQFFYGIDGANISTTYNDLDANGQPIGLFTIVDTGDASEGTVRVTLRHEPMKSEVGVAQGDITNAGGETDIEATFDVVIE